VRSRERGKRSRWRGVSAMKRTQLRVSLRAVTAWMVMIVAAEFSFGQPAVRDRIVGPVNDSPISTIYGNRRPWARPENDQGRVSDSFELDHITLVFKLSPDQQASLDTLLRELQDPSSPSYHKWLSPDQFGSRFGLSQDDISTVVAWLERQGFTVDRVARSHTWVVFSGTAGQVAAAFHIEIHHYLVNGAVYYANSGDPSVPSPLAGVVLGFRALDNFRPLPRVRARRVLPAAAPRFTSSISGDHYLAPNDFGTIYDVNALHNSGITGAGQSIAVMGQTAIYMSDIEAFRAASGLPSRDPTIVVIPGSPNPGVSANDLTESDLDLEWSGAVAPDANILFIDSGTANGAFDSLQYSIDEGVAPVLAITYGDCEADWGQSELASMEQEAEQANVEGITIVAAAGDSGAADCDESTSPSEVVKIATHGLAVDAPASLPNVTGVGGTEFSEGSGNYWSSSNNASNGSALSYIPETAWNDTSSANGLAASGGGASIFFTKPSWQTGEGVPKDGVRDVPDVALDASSEHDGYLICSDGSCVNGFRASGQTLEVVGGTSAGSPTFAAILALVNQATNSAVGQGNANTILYPLAAQFPDAFHDITSGNNQVPCQKGTPGCPSGGDIGYSAGPGYDQVTGLGSIDAGNLVSKWTSVSSAANKVPNFQLSISPTSLSIAAGASASATVTVSALNGFAGSVALACTVASSLTGVTCAVSPGSASAGGMASVTITRASQALSLPPPSQFRHVGWWGAGGLVLVCLWLLGLSVRRRDHSPARSRTSLRWSLALGIFVLVLVAGSIRCGGGQSAPATSSSSSSSTSTSGTSPQVAPVTTTVTVSGTASTTNGNISHSVLLSVTED
jgi:subtilase family serine protease